MSLPTRPIGQMQDALADRTQSRTLAVGGRAEFEARTSGACPRCKGLRLREIDVKGELARLAEQRGVAVEVVEHSDALVNLGGVGCLLRYSGPTNYLYSVA